MMIKQLHLIILHLMCKHDKKMYSHYQKKFKKHADRFMEVYNKDFNKGGGISD